MDWQEAAVAVIVGSAVAALYRHLRGIFASPKRGGGASCHGCGDCAPEDGDRGSRRRGRDTASTWTGTIH